MIEKPKLGMLLFIVSEAIFFVFLIFAYVYFRGAWSDGHRGPTATASLDPITTGLFSLALIGSSGTLWLSGRSLQQQRQRMCAVWLVATLGLGAIFLVGQGMEYARLLVHHVTVSRNLFGATFFTLTGFHGLHVLLGLVMLATMFSLIATGHLRTNKQSIVMDTVSLYWHFVDGVWLVIFAVVYLWTLH